MRNLPLAAALLCASCTTPEPKPSASSAPPPSPAATTLTGATPDAPITLRGRVSETPWQHMISSVPGKSDAYFDLDGGKEQTVVYWKGPPACAGDIIVSGTVIEVKGASKRPGGKADESVRELHIDVDAARCAD